MKRILVTGGAGFIGSNFIEYIYKKYPDYRLIVLDLLTYAGDIENIPAEIRNSQRFEFWYGDMNNLDLTSDLVGRSDIVVHFAAETHVARSLYSHRVFFVTDVLGTLEIAHSVADAYALTIVGGGDTDLAVHRAGVSDSISFISTGGGASLQLLEGKELPGIAALTDREGS